MSGRTEDEYLRYTFVCVVLGCASQFFLYTLYWTPYAFYSDAYTTCFINTGIAAVILNLVYYPCMQCPNDNLKPIHKVGSVLMVLGFVVATCYRLPIPIAPIMVAVFGMKTADHASMAFCGKVSVRIFVAFLLLSGTCGILFDAVFETAAGQEMYNRAKDETGILVGYGVSTLLYSLGVFLLHAARNRQLHAGSTIRFGCTAAFPIVGLLWGLSFIPSYNRGNDRFAVDSATELDTLWHVLTLLMSSILKTIALLCLAEASKLGELYSYSAFSAFPYLAFLLLTAEANHGMLPPLSWVGLAMIASALVLMVSIIHLFNSEFGIEDSSGACRDCAANKSSMCGLIYGASHWCNWNLRSVTSSHHNDHSNGLSHGQLADSDEDERERGEDDSEERNGTLAMMLPVTSV